MLDDVLFPGIPTAQWQMLPVERLALTGLLARLRPRNALEIGTYYGGSLSLIAQFAERVWAVDIDPAVPTRFPVPAHVTLRIGPADGLVAGIMDELRAGGVMLDFILIDADHSTHGVQRDIATVLARLSPPRSRCVILLHDSANPACREGILGANWASCPFVHAVDVDFVPGQLVGPGEVWGGFAMAVLEPMRPRAPARGRRQRPAAHRRVAAMHRGAQS